MKSKDVFTPGRFPMHTFVDDHLVGKKQQLDDVLDAGAMLVSLSGPSKSGKTVFVEQVIGRQNLLQITGAGVQSVSDLWIRVFHLIGTPVSALTSKEKSKSGTIEANVAASSNIAIAKAQGSLSGSSTISSGSGKVEETAIDHLQLLVKELAETDFIVFLDDFHYVPKEIQKEAAKQIKEAIRNNVKFICASVPYHADDVIRGNPDLRGRVHNIDFDYWKSDLLKKIAQKGFALLNIDCDDEMLDCLVAEAAGSPQLMQYLCLNTCHELDVRERKKSTVTLKNDRNLLKNICRRTVLSTDYGSVVDKMKEGPKTRGSDRKIYLSKAGWQGDVYQLLTNAIAQDPPKLTFRYQSLIDRITAICNGEAPSGSSVTSSCYHAASIVNETVGQTIVEWDGYNDVFDIRDPYFLFYLRWSEQE